MPADTEFIFYPGWDDWASLFAHRRYLETVGQPADPGAIPRTKQPLEAFAMDSPWDDWTSLYAHRRYLETRGKAADPGAVPRARTPLDAFGMDMPWADWVSLYAHRKYLETIGVPVDPGAIPRAKTPLDAFGMDSPWSDWVALFAHRRYLETKGQPADLKLPLPRVRTPWFDDEWFILRPRRRFVPPLVLETYPPRLRPALVQLFDWEPWHGLQQRRYLETLTPPPPVPTTVFLGKTVAAGTQSMAQATPDRSVVAAGTQSLPQATPL